MEVLGLQVMQGKTKAGKPYDAVLLFVRSEDDRVIGVKTDDVWVPRGREDANHGGARGRNDENHGSIGKSWQPYYGCFGSVSGKSDNSSGGFWADRPDQTSDGCFQ